jgi:EmrB/QacA subfamily drug resistance transporter
MSHLWPCLESHRNQYDTVSYRNSPQQTDGPPVQTNLPAAAAPAGFVTDPRRQRLILIAMCLSLTAVIASVSSLNVAQQALAIDLGASQNQLLWIINGYTMALAALLLPIGALGDRWGRKPILLTGLALFVAANTVAALSGGVTLLLGARVVAGVAAAMIMPVTLSVITSTFPAEQRGRAVGVWSGLAGAGGIVGVVVSSFLIDHFSWPWLFVMPIAVAVIALPMTLRVVPNSREHQEGRFDVVGSVLSAVAIGAIVLGIHEGPERGWNDSLTLFALTIGVVALASFIGWELRQDKPLLEIRLFAHRGLAAGSLTLLVVFAVMFGIFLVLVQFTQAVLGYSALKASASLLPMVVVMMPLSTIAPSIAARIGVRRTLIAGMTFFGTGLALLATMVSVSGGYLSILPGVIVLAVGIGLCMTPSTTTITESLPHDKQGVASALNDTMRELGGALGIALLGSLVSAGYRSSIAPATADLPPELAHRVQEGIGSAFASAGDLGASAPQVLDAAREALVDGWQFGMWIGVGIAAFAVLYLVVRGPRPEDTVVEDALDDYGDEFELEGASA